MGNSINLNQTGGTTSIGNIVQAGDGGMIGVNAAVSPVEIDRAFSKAISSLLESGRKLGQPDAVVQDAANQLQTLRDLAKESSPDKAKGSSILTGIRENFSWAYPVVKDVLSVAWPALLALV
jgi:hypothetical protein